jgi:hypothetical protein
MTYVYKRGFDINNKFIIRDDSKLWYRLDLKDIEDCKNLPVIKVYYHREDGPAWEFGDGEVFWVLDDIVVGVGKNPPNNWDELVAKSRAKRLLDL